MIILIGIVSIGTVGVAMSSGEGFGMMDDHHGMMGGSGYHMMDDDHMQNMHDDCEGHTDENCEEIDIEECEEENHDHCDHEHPEDETTKPLLKSYLSGKVLDLLIKQ
jgi:hypothetical protein